MPSAGAGHPQGHSCMVPCGGGKPQQGPARGRKLLGTACGGSRAEAASQLDKEIRPVPGYCISAHIQISSSQNCLLSDCVLFISASWPGWFFVSSSVCNTHLAFPSCLCAFLFALPCLREEEEEEEEEEQPVTEPNSEEEREDDAPCQGKDRYRAWTLPGSH